MRDQGSIINYMSTVLTSRLIIFLVNVYMCTLDGENKTLELLGLFIMTGLE